MSEPDVVKLYLYDALGRRATTELNVAPGTSSGVLAVGVSLLEALTPCAVNVIRRETLVSAPGAVLGATGPYSTHRDASTMNFALTAGGAAYPVSLPGVLPGILLGDGRTIDKTQTDVAAAVAWILANCTDDTGAALFGYRDGYRWFFNKP